MKNKSQLLFSSILIFSIFISGRAIQEERNDLVKVVASTTLVGDVVHQVGGDRIDLTVLYPVGADPHTFEPRPQDAAAITDAQIIFLNGLELEHSLEPLIESNASGLIIEISDGVEVLPFSAVEFTETSLEDGDDHGNGDPHVWMDPNLVKVWVKNITQALSEGDPDNITYYEENAASYIGELDALDQWIQEKVSAIPAEKRKIVTDHESFGYFADRYGFEIVGLIVSSLSTSASPSALDLAALQDTIKELNIPAIFIDATVNPALSEQIAADTGVKLIEIHNGSLGNIGSSTETYLLFMRANVQAIVDGLQ